MLGDIREPRKLTAKERAERKTQRARHIKEIKEKFIQALGFECKLYFFNGVVLPGLPYKNKGKYFVSVSLDEVAGLKNMRNVEVPIDNLNDFLARLRKIYYPEIIL